MKWCSAVFPKISSKALLGEDTLEKPASTDIVGRKNSSKKKFESHAKMMLLRYYASMKWAVNLVRGDKTRAHTTQWAKIRKKCNLGKPHSLPQRLNSTLFSFFSSNGGAPKEKNDAEWRKVFQEMLTLVLAFEIKVQHLCHTHNYCHYTIIPFLEHCAQAFCSDGGLAAGGRMRAAADLNDFSFTKKKI